MTERRSLGAKSTRQAPLIRGGPQIVGFDPPAAIALGFDGALELAAATAGREPAMQGFERVAGLALNFVHPATALPPARREEGESVEASHTSNDLSALLAHLAGAPAIVIQATSPPPSQAASDAAASRYFMVAEALSRGLVFWRGILRDTIGDWQWHEKRPLAVHLDAQDPDFNAFYDRAGLRFFHGDTMHGSLYSCESPDIVCHELGHAVLDAIKPQLWGAASNEAAALHEAFGDISALLCALQVEDVRTAVLRDTGGRIYSNSRVSRFGERLGAAVRSLFPQDVDPDCLRNMVNSFTYHDPCTLPHIAPASHLSSEPHSFSRILSGAFLEALAGLLGATTPGRQRPSEAQLAEAAATLAKLLVKAINAAPVVANLFAQIAAGMVREAAKSDPVCAAVLRAVFIRRNILSPRSAANVAGLPLAHRPGMGPEYDPLPTSELAVIEVDARHYGLHSALALEVPMHHRFFAAASAGPDASPIEPASALTTAKSFADAVFRRGRVDFAGAAGDTPLLNFGLMFTTHRLVASDSAVRLQRCCFDCGLRRD